MLSVNKFGCLFFFYETNTIELFQYWPHYNSYLIKIEPTFITALSTPIAGGLLENAVAAPFLHTFHGVPLSLAFLLPASLTLSAVVCSYSPCQIVPGSQITTTEQLQLEFPLHSGKVLIEK